MRFIFVLMAALTLQAQAAMLNPITDINYSCMFPITISVIPMGSSGNAGADSLDHSRTAAPLCKCAFPPPIFVRYGVPFGISMPAHIVETTPQQFNFPSLGILPKAKLARMGGSDSAGTSRGEETYLYSHIHKFNILSVIDIFQDALCLQASSGGSGFDIAYMSEIDPMAASSATAMYMFPETALLANPITAAACAADAVATLGGRTIDPMYWCVGGHTILPLSNFTLETASYEDASSITIAKSMYRLQRTTLGMSFPLSTGLPVMQGACQTMPAPQIIKSQHRFQTATPIRGSCERIGTPSIKWNIGKRSDTRGNKVDILWTRQDCCAL